MTATKPRLVTHDKIKAFETRYGYPPGIGQVMIDAGVWRLTDDCKENCFTEG
jgi:hypothetical protein